jgi:DNA-binding NarL/FixJ family response regulator
MIRVLIVDDHAVVRAGLIQILQENPDIQIIGEASDGLEAIEQALDLKPDVILLDIYMPRSNGLEAMLAIKEKMPRIKVLILTISERENDLFRAVRYGADGYLLKSATTAEVAEAVRTTASGESMLSPKMAARLIAEFREQSGTEFKLSEREKEVLQLVGEGLTNPEIAKRLFIGESTVRTHLQRLLEKLHLKNRTEAIAYINRHGAGKQL